MRNSHQFWMLKIVYAGCMPEVVDFKDLVSWCIKKLKKMDNLGGRNQEDTNFSYAPYLQKHDVSSWTNVITKIFSTQLH